MKYRDSWTPLYSSRAHCGRLKIELETTSQRLQSTVSRLNILEEQTDQHSRVHNKMAARLKAMDEHAKNQATQVKWRLKLLTGTSKVDVCHYQDNRGT